ncbi:hypothetical protein [Reichenbachiella sp.]|uniref:hypothetical protein n=1 Tax=Reichenbachiella sp. TaxID=2184521 RepID=UPI003BAF820A
MDKAHVILARKMDKRSIIPENQKILLTIGDWKGILNASEMKISIAIALNHCCGHHRMQLLGYLITDQEVSLIIEGKKLHVDHLLAKFYDEFVSVVADHLSLADKQGHVLKNWEKHREGALSDLFDRSIMHDPHLISLLLGQDIDLPYHSAEAEQLKQQIKTYDFCSAIDYSGAEGPVKVKTKWNKK